MAEDGASCSSPSYALANSSGYVFDRAALCWGCKKLAGILAYLLWPGGVARIGEILAASRGDLVLPCDDGELEGYILLSVKEPKTRSTAAHHQALRLDQSPLVQLVILA